jgi:hypothetical protein
MCPRMLGCGQVSVKPHPLPTNPNCVSFAVDAAVLFTGRTWGDLQDLAAGVCSAFQRVSGLPVLAGFAWRVALDRKNEQQAQGQLYFVFDGPATSEHLDALEAAVHLTELGFGLATVERAPLTGAPSAYAFGGSVHSVWSADPLDDTGDPPGEPWCRQIARSADGKIKARIVMWSQATPADQAPGLSPVLGVAAPYTEQEQDGERMRLAYARRLVEQILQASSPMTPEKVDYLEHLFPRDTMMRLALVDPDAVDEYYQAAREVLPFVLGYHDKLALVGVFFSACCRDGALDAKEMAVLREGGEMLGLTREQVVKYLRRFW